MSKFETFNTICPRDCFGGCTLSVTIENDKVIKVLGSKENNNSDGKICIKGVSYVKRLYHTDRLKHPMLRDKATNTFKQISWNEALDLIVDKLSSYKEAFGSESVMYLAGWGHMGLFNSYANGFWSQFGTVTSTYGSLCMAAGKNAVKYTYGNCVKHNHNSYIEKSKLIIVWGSNPANTNIHRMRHIRAAVKSGSTLIVIDPRVSETMIDGAIGIHPRPGTDALLAMGVAKLLIERGLCDHDFIDKHVLGFDEYKDRLNELSLDEIIEKTEVSIEELNYLVSEIEKNPIYALISGSGKSRYSNGGQTERAICILPSLTGNVGVENGGLYFTDDQRPKLKWDNSLKDGFKMNNTIHVGNMAKELETQTPKIKMLWIERANPLTSSPDVNRMKKIMDEIEFKVVVEHFMTDTSKLCDLVLPAAMFTEKNDLMSIYGDSYIQLLQKITPAYEECKSEAQIFRLLGERLGFNLDHLPIIDEDLINGILKNNNVNTTYEKLTNSPYLYAGYNPIAYENLVFDTPSGKIEILSSQMKALGQDPLPAYNEICESKYSSPELHSKYPIHFLSVHAAERINSQFTEMKLSKKHDVPRMQISSFDASSRGIADGELIKVFNDRGELRIIAEIGDIIKPGTVHIFEGWGEAFKASVNKLTSGRQTDIGNGTAFHDCLVEISKI